MTFPIDSREPVGSSPAEAGASQDATASAVDHSSLADVRIPMPPSLWRQVTRVPELMSMIGSHLDATSALNLLAAESFSDAGVAALVYALPGTEPRRILADRGGLSRVVRENLTDTHKAPQRRLIRSGVPVEDSGPSAMKTAWVAMHVAPTQAGLPPRTAYMDHALEWPALVTDAQLSAGGAVASQARTTLERLTRVEVPVTRPSARDRQTTRGGPAAPGGPSTSQRLDHEVERYLSLAPLDSGPLIEHWLKTTLRLLRDQTPGAGPKHDRYARLIDLLDTKTPQGTAPDGLIAGLAVALDYQDIKNPLLAQRFTAHLATQLANHQPADPQAGARLHDLLIRLVQPHDPPEVQQATRQMLSPFMTRLFDTFVNELTRPGGASASESTALLQRMSRAIDAGLIDDSQRAAARMAAEEAMRRPPDSRPPVETLQPLIDLTSR